MYLVKSCHKNLNALRCRRLKFGTLQEYIHTEEKQIADPFEGTFWTYIHLENVEAEPREIEMLTRGHHGTVAMHDVHLEVGGSSNTPGKGVYKAVKSKLHHTSSNRFIFCMSLLKNPDEAKGLFPEYDDYWYTSFENKKHLAKCLLSSLTSAIKLKESSGVKVFGGNYVLNEIECRVKTEEIYYRKRINEITNDNYEETKAETIKCVTGAAYIKPEEFAHEKEFRFGFYFFYKNIQLIPIVNNLIASTHTRMYPICKKNN